MWSYCYPVSQIREMKFGEMKQLTQNHTAGAALGQRHFHVYFIPFPTPHSLKAGAVIPRADFSTWVAPGSL